MTNINVKNATIRYQLRSGDSRANFISRLLGRTGKPHPFHALDNVSLDIGTGDRVALIGNNGAGKSTLLKVLSGILPLTTGSVTVKGSIFSALTISAGLQQNATCMQNVILRGLSYGLKGEDLRAFVSEAIEFSNLGDFINSPVKNLSSGMRSRLIVATLKGINHNILLMDEWIGAVDRTVAKRNKGLLSDLARQSDIFILASHREALLKELCNKAVVLNSGKLLYYGDLKTGLSIYHEAGSS